MRTRPAVLLTAVALSGLLTAGAAGSAAAHGDTIHFDISSPAGGHPQTVATWENDGDPVTEALAATLSAVSADGHQLGPWRLVAVPGTPSTFTTREQLPVGHWKLTVESGFPALGRGEADVTVAGTVTVASAPTAGAPAPGAPGAPAVGPSAVPETSKPVAAPGSSATDGWITVGIGAALAALTAGVLTVVARHRRRTS